MCQNGSTFDPKIASGANIGKVYCGCYLLHFGAIGPSKVDPEINEKWYWLQVVISDLFFNENVSEMASGWEPNGPLKLYTIALWCPMGSWGTQETALGVPRDALMCPMDAPGLHLGALDEDVCLIWHAFGQYFGICCNPSRHGRILSTVTGYWSSNC